MNPGASSSHRKAKILGPGAVVTLENTSEGARVRVRVVSRSGRDLRVEPLAGTGLVPTWTAGDRRLLRTARPSGLYLQRATVEQTEADGSCSLKLEPGPARRKQQRHYFRMPVRLGVRLESKDEDDGEIVVLRACNLSGNGILLLDPLGYLEPGLDVRLVLPIGPAGDVVRLDARVVRAQEDSPRRVALSFEGIGDGTRQLLLRYLVRQHRQHLQGGCGSGEGAKVYSIERP
jgi:hypothetical protein